VLVCTLGFRLWPVLYTCSQGPHVEPARQSVFLSLRIPAHHPFFLFFLGYWVWGLGGRAEWGLFWLVLCFRGGLGGLDSVSRLAAGIVMSGLGGYCYGFSSLSPSASAPLLRGPPLGVALGSCSFCLGGCSVRCRGRGAWLSGGCSGAPSGILPSVLPTWAHHLAGHKVKLVAAFPLD